MIDIVGIVLGFILGILSSYLFWKYLLSLKPQLKISPYILKGKSLKYESDTVYRLKMFNNSNRPIVNFNIKIAIGKIRELNDGSKRSVIDKVIKNQYWAVLGPKKNIGDHWGLTPVFNITFKSTGELEELLSDKENVIQLTIICFDGNSGSAFASRTKYEKKDILNGNFSYGLNLNIAKGKNPLYIKSKAKLKKRKKIENNT